MRHYSQTFAITLASLTAFPAAATPTDALINNTLSLPAELNKAIIVDKDVTQDIAELRGQLWPFILGVVAVDLALQTYFYGVYVPQNARTVNRRQPASAVSSSSPHCRTCGGKTGGIGNGSNKTNVQTATG